MGHQRHRAQALAKARQHTGRSTLRLIFCIAGGLQRSLSRRARQQQGQRQRPLTPAGLECVAQGIRLKTIEHDQQLGFGQKQHIGRVSRGGRPGQGNLAHSGLQLQQGGIHASGQLRRQFLTPSGALLRRPGSRQTGQRPGGLNQPPRQHLLVRTQTGLRQQTGGSQPVARRVHGQLAWRRYQRPGQGHLQVIGPVHGGLKTWHESSVALRGPGQSGLRHQLRIRHQHHAGTGMKPPGGDLLTYQAHHPAPVAVNKVQVTHRVELPCSVGG